MYVIYPRCYEAKPSNPKGVTSTTTSEGSMQLAPHLTAFHQSQTEKSLAAHSCSIPLGNTFVVMADSIREQRLKSVGYAV